MKTTEIIVKIEEKDISVEMYKGSSDLDNTLGNLLTLRIVKLVEKTIKDIEELKEANKVIH